MARGLQELYGDIDALEFYPGLLLEKARPTGIFGESMVEMGAPFSWRACWQTPSAPWVLEAQHLWGRDGLQYRQNFHFEETGLPQHQVVSIRGLRVPRNEEEAKPRKPSTEF